MATADQEIKGHSEIQDVKGNKLRELSHPRLNEDRSSSSQSQQSGELRVAAPSAEDEQNSGLDNQNDYLNSSLPLHNNLELLYSLSSKKLKILAKILS